MGRVTVHQTKEILEDYNIRTQLGEFVVARYCNINKDEKNEDDYEKVRTITMTQMIMMMIVFKDDDKRTTIIVMIMMIIKMVNFKSKQINKTQAQDKEKIKFESPTGIKPMNSQKTGSCLISTELQVYELS